MFGKLFKWALIAYFAQALFGIVMGTVVGLEIAASFTNPFDEIARVLDKAAENARLF